MSDKQCAARERNHKIFRLRGLYATSRNLLSPDNEVAFRDIIDQELRRLGALEVDDHRRAEREKLRKKGVYE